MRQWWGVVEGCNSDYTSLSLCEYSVGMISVHYGEVGRTVFGRASRTVNHILWYLLGTMIASISWRVCWYYWTCRTIFHDWFCDIIGIDRSRWVARVIIESYYWVNSAGNVNVVTRSGACVVVCTIDWRLVLLNRDRVLDKLVVISRRYVVRSSTSYVYRR